MQKAKLAEKVGKGIKSVLKTFGIKSDDIIEMLDGIGIDEFAGNIIEDVKKESGKERIILIGYSENGKFSFRAVSLEMNSENRLEVGESYPLTFFEEKKDAISLHELVSALVKKVF